jgi:hypothetical protein
MEYLIIVAAIFAAVLVAKMAERLFRIVTKEEFILWVAWVGVATGIYNVSESWLKAASGQQMAAFVVIAIILGIFEKGLQLAFDGKRGKNSRTQESSRDECDDDGVLVECRRIGWQEGMDAAKRLVERRRQCESALERIVEGINAARDDLDALSKSKSNQPRRDALKAKRNKLRALKTKVTESSLTAESALDDLHLLALSRGHGDANADAENFGRLLDDLDKDNRLLAQSIREVEDCARLDSESSR